MSDKPALAIKRWHFWRRMYGFVRSVGLKLLGVDGISQHGLNHTLKNSLAQEGRIDGEERLDACVEVALHHIGAAQVYLLCTVVVKVVDPAMLQKASNNAADANLLADAGNTGAQAANTAHDQFYANSGL